MPVLLGGSFMQRLVELGVIPPSTRRVVVEASIDSATMIYIEQYGDKRLLGVVAADFLGAEIIMEDRNDGSTY